MEKPKQNKLTQKELDYLEELRGKIRGFISTSALAKIELGELLIKNEKQIEYGGMVAFYRSVKINTRTAQHYKNIASNEGIQILKQQGKLDYLNMTEILELAGINTNKKKPVLKPKYILKSIDVFNPTKCHSRSELRSQYTALHDSYNKIQAELDELKGVKVSA